MLKPLIAPHAHWAPVPLRLVLGLVFAAHGGQKLFQQGVSGTTGFMESLGIPAPAVAAVVLIAVELLGGLALIGGVFVRWVTLLLIVDMLVALVVVHLPNGFFLPRGSEFVLTLLAGLLALFLLGAGPLSLDRGLEASRTDRRDARA